MLEGTLLGIATAVIWGVGDFLSRKPSAEIGSILVSILIQPIGLVIMIFVLLSIGLQNSIQVLTANPNYFALDVGTGLIAFLGIVYLYRGYLQGVMSVVAPIAGAFPVVAVILSILLLGVTLTPIKSIAIFSTIVGIILTGVKLSSFRQLRKGGSSLGRERLIKGVDYAFLALFCAGFVLFLQGVVAPILGSILAVVVLKFSETIIAGVTLLTGRIKLVRPSSSALGWVVVIGICDAGGFVAYNLAITSAGGSLPIVVTLAGLIGLVTIILARIFYGEKLEKIQILGVAIIFVAVATILYF
jgi:uncharacterized membrane protein